MHVCCWHFIQVDICLTKFFFKFFVVYFSWFFSFYFNLFFKILFCSHSWCYLLVSAVVDDDASIHIIIYLHFEEFMFSFFSLFFCFQFNYFFVYPHSSFGLFTYSLSSDLLFFLLKFFFFNDVSSVFLIYLFPPISFKHSPSSRFWFCN